MDEQLSNMRKVLVASKLYATRKMLVMYGARLNKIVGELLEITSYLNSTFGTIINDYLKLHKVPAKCVVRILTSKQKRKTITTSDVTLKFLK